MWIIIFLQKVRPISLEPCSCWSSLATYKIFHICPINTHVLSPRVRDSEPKDRPFSVEGHVFGLSILFCLEIAMSCSYSCSAPPPPLSPDNDITGVGVIINYTVTAGIALLVIFIHYVVVYDPSHDPFQMADDSDPPFRPNPVDEVFLRGLRCWPKYLWSRIMGPRRMGPHFSARLERTSIKVGHYSCPKFVYQF